MLSGTSSATSLNLDTNRLFTSRNDSRALTATVTSLVTPQPGYTRGTWQGRFTWCTWGLSGKKLRDPGHRQPTFLYNAGAVFLSVIYILSSKRTTCPFHGRGFKPPQKSMTRPPVAHLCFFLGKLRSKSHTEKIHKNTPCWLLRTSRFTEHSDQLAGGSGLAQDCDIGRYRQHTLLHITTICTPPRISKVAHESWVDNG